MGKRLVWVSDFDFKSSGYFNISIGLLSHLVAMGWDVRAVGLGYDGREHSFPFPIIPVKNLQEVNAVVQNLRLLWLESDNAWEHHKKEPVSKLVVALDIPLQERILQQNQAWAYDYYGIFPLEAPPLTLSWSMVLWQMKKQFVISKFGTAECNRVGVPAQYLPVGVDRSLWRTPYLEERQKIRETLYGVSLATKIVLTVADNQERKNLTAAMDAFKIFSEEYPDSLYVLVTRKNNPVGWKLDDYAAEIGIMDKFIVFERGMAAQDLWAIYAAADMFVLSSKTEGLGLPLTEALSVGLPCIGTDCSGIKEQLDGRGFLVPYAYTYRDTFGNGYRYLIDIPKLAQTMIEVARDVYISSQEVDKYLEERDWKYSAELLDKEMQDAE